MSSADVLGAIKWFFVVRLWPKGGAAADAAGRVADEGEVVSVHWEASVKLFVKVPQDDSVMDEEALGA